MIVIAADAVHRRVKLAVGIPSDRVGAVAGSARSSARHVPEPDPPERAPRTHRLPAARHRLPPHHEHLLRRRVRPASHRWDGSLLRQGRHRRGHRRHPTGDIGALGTAIQVQGLTYLTGGLIFGTALYRARVLARWASALLAIGGVVTVVLSVMPDAFRLLAFPNGIAMIGLGYSL
ncbi:hypothetical protein AB0F68_13360 [Micromonospora sp. NPDC023966]|uniref:hypothetical protein n=1 Tax=Micromonospora sp. NPDC023966 TaxID=3154699 RepID=UPI0033D71256